jgi:hypothetical protein
LAHGVQVRAVNQADQTGAIASIYAQNPRLRDVVRIVRVGWAKRTLTSGERVAALYIGVAEPDQANHLIDTGLLINSELYDCELFDGSCYITQCFKCYQYNHTAKHCKSVARCGFCGTAGSTQPSSSIPSEDAAAAKATHIMATCTTASPRDPPPESIIEVEMPDRDSEPEHEVERLVASRKTTRSTKATLASDSDSDFPDLQGYNTVRRRQHKATRQGRTAYGTQDIRNAIVITSTPSSYK